MTIARMAWRGLRARPGITLLTVLSIALGTALVCAVLTLHRSSRQGFLAEVEAFDMVVGAKGSGLQLVLSSLYHLDVPPGNIGHDNLAALRSNRWVHAAVPIGLGDNVEGFRIVGTESNLFALPPRGGRGPMLRVAEGRLFAAPFEAVLGSEAARGTGLWIGDEFVGTHGLVASEVGKHHEFPYTVVGVLAPSGLAADRGVYTPLESVWKLHSRESEIHGDEYRQEVTAVLVRLNSIAMRMNFMQEVNKSTEAMAVSPVLEMLRLRQNLIEPLQRVLLLVAALVIVVAALAVLATLLQAAEQRRRDRAVLRALGAYPGELFLLVLLEALITVLLGMALGWLLGHGLLALAGESIRTSMGMRVAPWNVGARELQALAMVFGAGAIAGLVPAALHYRRSPVRDLKQAG